MNKNIIIRIIFFAFIAAFFTELLFTFDSYEAERVLKCHNPEQVIHIEDCMLEGCTLLNGRVISDGNDPKIIISAINCQVDNVMLRVKELSTSAIDVQLFYTDNAPYLDENSVRYVLADNEYAKTLVVDHFASDLRIDIGNSQDVSYIVDAIVVNPHKYEYLCGHFQNLSLKRILIYLLGWLFVLFAFYDWNTFCAFLFRYRWLLGGAIICFSTALKLHGSSIGIMAEYLTGADSSRLFGVARAIRTDEYVLFTEMALSQKMSNFKWFSDIWGYSPSDMFIIYGQPVRDFVTIFRPFSLGYLFLGAEYGLSFYWSSRMVVLYLVSFEFGRLFTKDNRSISVVYAFLVAFAPVVQWWFSINEFVEMLIFGQGAVVLINCYIDSRRIREKCLIMFGIIICAGGYALSLYPAWMIPFFYVFAACAIGLIIEKKANVKIKLPDVFIVLAGITVLLISVIHIVNKSGNTLNLISDTIYPGKRVYAGGSGEIWLKLFLGWTGYLWSFIDISNPCEEVCFFSFFPIGIIFSFIVLFRKKVKDVWLVLLNICNIFLITYAAFEFPEFWGKITMLNHSSIRISNAVGFLNMILMIRALISLDRTDKKVKYVIPLGVLIGAFSVFSASKYLTPQLKGIVIVIIIMIVALLFVYDEKQNQEVIVSIIAGIALISGIVINPIQSGLGDLYKARDIQNIKEVNDKDSGLWLVDNPVSFYSNLPTVVGADTMTALATYPDYNMWEDLGLESESDIWNRYAHFQTTIDQETYINLIYSDLIELHISMDKIKSLGVKYIYSFDDLSTNNELIQIKEHIYKVRDSY